MAVTDICLPLPCPTCERQPDVDQCGPGLGWYAVCYSLSPVEHCVGVNGDTREQAVAEWNAEVVRVPL